MTENMKATLKAVSEDEEMRAEASALMAALASASDEDRAEVVARVLAFASDKGLELDEEDLVIEATEEGEIEDEQLALVAGGCCGADAFSAAGHMF